MWVNKEKLESCAEYSLSIKALWHKREITSSLQQLKQKNKGITSTSRTIAEEQTDALVLHDTLDHGETLLVVSTSDAEDVTLPLGAERVGHDLLGHALVVEWAPINTTSGGEMSVRRGHDLGTRGFFFFDESKERESERNGHRDRER
jgi:hypothetical protein